jgi:hypothetical protein
MLTETLFRISFSVIGRCSLVRHWLQGNAQELTCHRRLTVPYDIQNHRRLPVSISSVKNRRFRVFEAGLLEGFSKLVIVSNFKGAS